MMKPSRPLLPAVLLALLLLPLLALARVGGGESYGSGDDFGGGGEIEILYFLIRLIIYEPQLGIPVALVVGVVWVVRKRRSRTAGARRRREHERGQQRTRVSPAQVQAWVNRLQQRDPDFSLEPLLARTRELVIRSNEAWFRRDLTPMRAFFSDATWQRLATQLAIMQRRGVRDAITDLEIDEVSPVGLEQNPWYDTLHLRVVARIRDTEVPATTSDAEALGKAKSARQEAFTEVWSFTRKLGAKTRIGHDLFQGTCPSCGAPFAGGATNSCEYCGAIVNSGNYDWTLAQITQGSAFQPAAAAVEGVSTLRERDPAFTVNLLEDRAALLFWRWIQMRVEGRIDPLLKVAHPDFRSGVEEVLAQHPGAVGGLDEVALGAARLLRIIPGSAGPDGAPGHDHALVEIRWSLRSGQTSRVVPQTWRFVLSRRADAQTPSENGIASSRCHNCHGPLTDSASTSCDYCGTPLDAGGDWVILQAGAA
ncbi:MAG TPA: Tim44-like domain-containing protein [Myxococcaceae bacterium]|nr:Tim44-like domain-containing protein [Myxococcaceae bacterium]